MPGVAAAEMGADTPKVRDLEAAADVSFGTSGLRGLVKDFTPELWHAYMQAFLGLGVPRARGLLIGHDLRPSSPGIAALCHLSACEAGGQTHHAGPLPTPALTYAAQELGLPDRHTASDRLKEIDTSACWRGLRATGRPCAPSSPPMRGLCSRSTRSTACA